MKRLPPPQRGLILLMVWLVLFGLLAEKFSVLGEEPSEHQHGVSLRRRKRSLIEAINNFRELQVPPMETWSSTRPNNPYWRLPWTRKDYHSSETQEKTFASTIQEEGKEARDIYHAAQAHERSSESTLLAPVIDSDRSDNGEGNFRDNLKIMTQNLFVQQCMELLESHADQDKQLNRAQYVSFLQDISNDSLEVDDFTDLPLFLAMIFFSASCSNGEDCVSNEAAMSITPVGTRENQMNQVLCRQLMRFPFMEILLPFQFLIRVNSGLSAAELMLLGSEEGDDREADQEEDLAATRIVPNLEGALDQVLLQGFNCSYVPGEPIANRRREMPPRQRSQLRQPQPQTDCDYVVQVTVEDAADYPCGFRSSCILIFSDVTVYAVLKDDVDEPALRKMTSDVLRDAINGNALNEFFGQ